MSRMSRDVYRFATAHVIRLFTSEDLARELRMRKAIRPDYRIVSSELHYDPSERLEVYLLERLRDFLPKK